jgi:hypothetical protein
MTKRRYATVIIFSFALFLAFAASGLPGDAISRMSRDDLKAMLGHPDLIILDVRAASDWTESHSKIEGAIREDPKEVASWAGKYSKEKILVLY